MGRSPALLSQAHQEGGGQFPGELPTVLGPPSPQGAALWPGGPCGHERCPERCPSSLCPWRAAFSWTPGLPDPHFHIMGPTRSALLEPWPSASAARSALESSLVSTPIFSAPSQLHGGPRVTVHKDTLLACLCLGLHRLSAKRRPVWPRRSIVRTPDGHPPPEAALSVALGGEGH